MYLESDEFPLSGFYFFKFSFICAGSHDAYGLGQLASHVRVVLEEFRRVDRSAVDTGVLHHFQMAERSGISVFRSNGAPGHIDPVRVGQHIVLLFDICLL